jgi:hypothetical protein
MWVMAKKATSGSSRKPELGSNTTESKGWRGVFLSVLGESGSVSDAIAAAGVDPAVAYAARAEDPAFAGEWDAAAAAWVDRVGSPPGGPVGDGERAAGLLASATPKGQFRTEPVVEEGDRSITLAELLRRAQDDDSEL